MKKSTQDWLLEFVKSHSLNSDYMLHDLFYKEIIPREYNSITELIIGINDFCSFLIKHASDINFYAGKNKKTVIKIIEDTREKLTENFLGYSTTEQMFFAEVLANVVEKPNQKSILEVGSGVFPIASLHMAKKFKRVSAMNPYFFLSTLALNNMKVYPISNMFNINTDISDFDIVVGKCPCSAIEPIVKLCSAQKKPYFVELCNCSIDEIYAANTDSYGWENVLPTFDPDIKFYKNFAFHLDEKTEKVIESINKFYMFDKRNTKFVGGKYINNMNLYVSKSELKDKGSSSQEPFDDLGIFY